MSFQRRGNREWQRSLCSSTHQAGTTWNLGWATALTVAEVRWNLQFALLTDTHTSNTEVPAADYGSLTKSKVERRLAFVARVELLSAVQQCAPVVHAYRVAVLSVSKHSAFRVSACWQVSEQTDLCKDRAVLWPVLDADLQARLSRVREGGTDNQERGQKMSPPPRRSVLQAHEAKEAVAYGRACR